MISLLHANWKFVVTTTIWTLIVLNVIFFVYRSTVSDNCDVELLIRQHRVVQVRGGVRSSSAMDQRRYSMSDPVVLTFLMSTYVLYCVCCSTVAVCQLINIYSSLINH